MTSNWSPTTDEEQLADRVRAVIDRRCRNSTDESTHSQAVTELRNILCEAASIQGVDLELLRYISQSLFVELATWETPFEELEQAFSDLESLGYRDDCARNMFIGIYSAWCSDHEEVLWRSRELVAMSEELIRKNRDAWGNEVFTEALERLNRHRKRVGSGLN